MPLLDCTTPCTIGPITSTGCNDQGGMIYAFWTKRSDIATVTIADGIVTAYTMVGDGIFHPIEFQPEGSSYASNYTEEQGFYENIIDFIFTGKSSGTREAITAALRCCDIVVHIYDRNCQQRVYGFEEVDDEDAPMRYRLKPIRIGTHNDTSGTFGGDMAQDQLILSSKSLTSPYFGDVDLADLPTTIPTP